MSRNRPSAPAPYQLHRFIELIKEEGVDLKGKYASQITTSKHFYDVAIMICEGTGEENLRGMIEDFRAALPCRTRDINLREFPFAGGCLGCLGCAVTGKCVYKDGFDDYLRNEIQTADAIVYALQKKMKEKLGFLSNPVEKKLLSFDRAFDILIRIGRVFSCTVFWRVPEGHAGLLTKVSPF